MMTTKIDNLLKARICLFHLLLVSFLFSTCAQFALASAPSSAAQGAGGTSISTMRDQFIQAHPEVSWLKNSDIRDANNNPIPTLVNPALTRGAGPYGSLLPPTLAANMTWLAPSKVNAGMYVDGLNQFGGFNGHLPSDLITHAQDLQAGTFLAGTLQYPPNVANQAKTQALGQGQAMSNAMGDLSKSQSASAINYCAGFLPNFTVDEGNRWNKIRTGLFVPMAILLLLPGAVLAQVKATIATGNPVLGTSDDLTPLDGICRSVIAIFLIPGTYLVVNYGIDFSNAVTSSIANSYQSIMNGNMYEDALSAQVNAFPVRTPKQNQNAGAPASWPMTAINSVADFEQNFINNQSQNKTDEAMPAGAVAARQLAFGANAALTAGWNVLCAFQMAYLAYLFFVGPVVAALWVWPISQFRQALPAWIEGVLTLCFWSMFWNTAILLMACFKGVDQNGTMITTALNFLAVSSVKYAFDFVSLVKDAGQDAAQKAISQASSGGGQKSGGSAAGKAGAQGKGNPATAATQGQNPSQAPASGAPGGGQPNGLPDNGLQLQPAVNGRSVFAGVQGTGSGIAPGGFAASPGSVGFAAVPVSGALRPSSPPMPLPPQAGQPNPGGPILSQSVRLGNYTLSGNGQGQELMLRNAQGIVIAQLPAGMTDGQSVAGSDGSHLTYSAASGFSLTDSTGQTHSAQFSPLDSGTAGSPPIVPGALNPGNPQRSSVALRSAAAGTLLLENNGNTLLMPRADGGGYDTFSLQPNDIQSSFPLAGGSNLSMTRQGDGSEQISILNGTAGGTESFAVVPNANAAQGYNIGRSVNGQPASYSRVSLDGDRTMYHNYAPNGNLSDIEAVSANSMSSTYFDPNNGVVLGNVVSDYQDNGNSRTSYYDANGSLTASTSQFYKEGGGVFDEVRDSSGQIISSQDVNVTADGGYTVATSKYDGGAVTSSYVSSYDSHANLLGTAPVELSRNSSDTNFVSHLSQASESSSTTSDFRQSAQPLPLASSQGASSPNAIQQISQSANFVTADSYSGNTTDNQLAMAISPSTNYERSAAVAQQSNNFEGSADVYQQSQNFERSADVYQQSQSFEGTPAVYQQKQNLEGSPSVYQQSQNLEGSANVYQQAQNLERSADVSQQSQYLEGSAAVYQQAQNLERSADVSQRSQYLEGSAAVYQQAQNLERVSQQSTNLERNHQMEIDRSVEQRTVIAGPAITQTTLSNAPKRTTDLTTLLAPQPAAKVSAPVFAGRRADNNRLPGNGSTGTDSSVPPLFTPASKSLAANKLPPVALNKVASNDDKQLIASATSFGHNSLQEQMIASSNGSRQKTFNQILKPASSSTVVAEALANAQANYKMVASLLSCGRAYQAQQLLNIVLREIETIRHLEEAGALSKQYAELLNRYHMNLQAQSFQNYLNSNANDSRAFSVSNPW